MKYVSPVKRDTELRLVDIKLNEGVETIQMSVIKVTVECSRCKCRTDLLCKENKVASQVCSKCSHWISVQYNPDLLHSSNPTLAYLDLLNCKVTDLILLCYEGVSYLVSSVGVIIH
ncbi:PREDICTED: uncharacterized protein LOC100640341 [Amphimedon queenslandica]|uniref:Uncharacterized protein n=1 Tax=Amphimedon queenslandica TaxID=400682 RepID=A0AAN0JRM7_AMPQE|nr:PREDICTED: uncharacterized protein LOC100640341 [Amphimedon queenslandica]|eukprot:XP_019859498.1 PREDICTED: uncharacterized protein LOC100640341 [Amphimedon queenslandica]